MEVAIKQNPAHFSEREKVMRNLVVTEVNLFKCITTNIQFSTKIINYF